MSAALFDEEHFEIAAMPALRPRAIPLSYNTHQAALRLVCNKYGVSLMALLARDRHKRISHVRCIAYWKLRQHGYSYPEIGALMQRDHTTVMVGVRKVESERLADPAFARELEELRGAA